jgi:hypothetical protein
MNSCFQKHTSKISRKFILLLLLSTSFQLGSNAQAKLITIDNGGEATKTSSDAPIKMDSEAAKEKEAAEQELKEKSNKVKSNGSDTKSLMPFYLPFPVICTNGLNAEFSKFNNNSFQYALAKCNGYVAVNYDDIKNKEKQSKSKSLADQNKLISKQAKALIDLERQESIESLYQLQLFIQNKVELDNATYIPLPIPNKEQLEKVQRGSYSDACSLYVSTLLTIVEFYPFVKDKYTQLGIEIPSGKSDINPVELVSQLNSKIQINTKQ